jgi:hypothetical protein
MLDGVKDIVGGGGGFIVKVTGIVIGLLAASAAEMVITAFWLLTPISEIFTETLTASLLPVEVPLVGLKLSQPASPVTNQFIVCPPEFHIVNVWPDGVGPPRIFTKLKLDGLKARAGGTGGLMVRLTGIVFGLLVAPEAEMVMVAL